MRDVNIIIFGNLESYSSSFLCSMVAARVYSNADTQKVSILSENIDKSGIYC